MKVERLANTSLKWRIEFEVEGPLPLPLDMLRYDACFPARSEDAFTIEHGFDATTNRGRVRLVHYAETRTWLPTIGRWQSFGWTLDRIRNAELANE